jgi:hypothetical protein
MVELNLTLRAASSGAVGCDGLTDRDEDLDQGEPRLTVDHRGRRLRRWVEDRWGDGPAIVISSAQRAPGTRDVLIDASARA